MAQEIWKKRILVPIWLVQFLVCIIYTGTSAVALVAVSEAAADGDFNGETPSQLAGALDIGAAVIISLSVFTILLDIAEIIMLVRSRLTPVVNLVLQCIKATIWTIFFVLIIGAVAKGSSSPTAILLAAIIFLTSLAQLIYGSIILHRHRTRTLYQGDYALTSGGQLNAQPYLATNAQPSYAAYRPPTPDFGDGAPSSQPYAEPMMYEMHNRPVRDWP